MDVSPGYKQTEIGVLPEQWDCARIGNAAANSANAIVGGPFGSDLVSADYAAAGVPVIRGQNMSAALVSGDFVFVSPEKAKSLSANLAHAGDLVFTQRGTLGQVSMVPGDGFDSYLISQSQMKVSLNQTRHDSHFVRQYFSSRAGQKQIMASAIQTGVPHTNLGILRAYRFPAPPLHEQRAIAVALSDVDALLRGLDRLIAKKRDLKQAVMQQLLTGQTRLPGFHGEWEVKALRDIVRTPITDGPHLTPKFLADGVPFLSVNNLVNNRLDLRSLRFVSRADHLEFSKKCKPGKGDILFGKAASVGMVALIDTDMELNIWSPLALIRVDHHTSEMFVFYALQARHIHTQINLRTNSSSQGNIGMSCQPARKADQLPASNIDQGRTVI
jgi:type I restriction enzyme S subunit